MMKKVLVLFVFVFLLMPMFVFGQTKCTYNINDGSGLPPCSTVGYIEDPSEAGISSGIVPEETTLSELVVAILALVNWLSWFVGLAAVVMGLYSGFLFITARDNANQLTTARQTMMYAIIGIGVAIIAFSLVSLSKSLLAL
ncbi:MAG TPA: hypothetical protein VJK01_02270 [Candidatus Paceibacterota bacterium]